MPERIAEESLEIFHKELLEEIHKDPQRKSLKIFLRSLRKFLLQLLQKILPWYLKYFLLGFFFDFLLVSLMEFSFVYFFRNILWNSTRNLLFRSIFSKRISCQGKKMSISWETLGKQNHYSIQILKEFKQDSQEKKTTLKNPKRIFSGNKKGNLYTKPKINIWRGSKGFQ